MKKLVSTIKVMTMLAGVALIASSCKYEVSNTTGWDYNNPRNGGFQKVPYAEQETGPGLILIEGGTFTMGRVEQDVTYDWDNTPRRVTVSSFYLDEFEISNFNYLEYLYWVRRTYESFPMVYKNALPDTLVWRSKLAYNEPYVEYYLRHPAYRDYPVVGVSWLQANDFCKWRTDRVNEFILIREGVLDWNPMQQDEPFTTDAYFSGQYNVAVRNYLPDLDPSNPGQGKRGRKALGDRIVRMEDGILLPRYRLPTEAEWEFAAYGLIGNTIDERIVERRLYPWNGHWVRNPDDKWQGDMMANFVRGKGDYMGVAGSLNDAGDITTPVDAYWPNDYGLYHMAGNVSEWVMDVYRPMSADDFDEFRPFRGNVFKTKVLTSQGAVADKFEETIYDVHAIKEYLIEFRKTREFSNGTLVGSRQRMDPYEDSLLNVIMGYVEIGIEYWNEGEYILASEQIRNVYDIEFDQFIGIDQNRPNWEPEISPMLRKGMAQFVVNTPGRLKEREVVAEENLNRRNYQIADNINYLDGDLNSSIYYNSSDAKQRINSDSSMIRENRYEKNLMYQNVYDQEQVSNPAAQKYTGSLAMQSSANSHHEDRMTELTPGQPTSLISDRSRVYKGGNWKDRAYWMNAGTRRFLDEEQSTATIGFRCAMDRVGSPVGLGSSRR